jgi:hypothetical protein
MCTPPVTTGEATLILPLLSMLLLDFSLAAVVSTIFIIRISPTLRGRWSSNRGRSPLPAWKMAPLPTGGAFLSIARAVSGGLMLVEGVHAHSNSRPATATLHFIKLNMANLSITSA